MIILVSFEEISKLISVTESLKRDSMLYALTVSFGKGFAFEMLADLDSTGQVPFLFLGTVL